MFQTNSVSVFDVFLLIVFIIPYVCHTGQQMYFYCVWFGNFFQGRLNRFSYMKKMITHCKRVDYKKHKMAEMY